MMLWIASALGAVALAAIGVLQMARSSRKWPTAEGRVLRPEEIKAAGTLPYSFAFEYTVGGTRFISGTVELFASKEGARGLSKSSARFTGRRVLQPDGATPRDAYSWRIEAALGAYDDYRLGVRNRSSGGTLAVGKIVTGIMSNNALQRTCRHRGRPVLAME